MKKLLNPILVIGIILLGYSTGLAQNKHLGLWKGIDQGEVGYINFDSTGFAYFVIDEDTVGGESFTMNEQEAYMKYEVNYSKSLKTLDFIIYLKSNDQELGRLLGIFKFDEKDRLILCVSFKAKERPGDFKEEENTIVLEKINTVNNKK